MQFRAAMSLVAMLVASIGAGIATAGERIYKWTDEKGVTHYGEAIPPEYSDHSAAEMNKRGITLRKIEGNASLEAQRRAAQEKALAEREEQKRLFEQRRRDIALVNTYASPHEIDEARERNLSAPQQALRSLEPRMKKAQEDLAGLQQKLESMGKSGKPVPDFLKQDVEEKRLELVELQAERERHESQIQAIRNRYEADKRRFTELTQR
jgi:hypothetical protein